MRDSRKGVTSLVLSGSVFLLVLLIGVAPATAASGYYAEDLYTTQYEDTSMTNATGWGSGALRLPRTNLTTAGYYETSGSPLALALSDSIVYLAQFHFGLQVVNITDPTWPTLLGGCDAPGAVAVTVVGGIAYVANQNSGLQVINVTNPRQPTLLGSFAWPYAWDVVVSNGIAWVACLNSGLLAIDVTNPRQPILVSQYSTANPANSVAVSGDIAYLAVINQGLEVVDIADPGQPKLLSSFSTFSSAERVTAAAGIAFIADGPSGLQLINITNPQTPTLLSSYGTAGYAWDVAVNDHFAYVADGILGLLVIDITNPSSPTLLGGFDTPGMPMKVAVAGGVACVLAGSGMEVLKMSSNLGEGFKPLAAAQSLIVFEATGGFITRATLSCFPKQPTGTRITYALSADGGVHWETVTPNNEHFFASLGSDLCWCVVLTSSDPLQTPIMTGLAIVITVENPTTITTNAGTNAVIPWWNDFQLTPVSLLIATAANTIIVIVSWKIIRERRRLGGSGSS